MFAGLSRTRCCQRSRRAWRAAGRLFVPLAALALLSTAVPAPPGPHAQEDRPPQPSRGVDKTTAPAEVPELAGDVELPENELLHVPVVNLQIGGVKKKVTVRNPAADDPQAALRGMRYFNQFNCVGCHAPNGAGGMGPSLSNAKFIYGGEPENIYLSILQGRPKGMPSWSGRLPDHVIWDLVAYVRSISREPAAPWGRTTSADGFSIEQVPAEFITSVDPWRYTTPFSYGQAPFEKPKGAPPLETPRQ